MHFQLQALPQRAVRVLNVRVRWVTNSTLALLCVPIMVGTLYAEQADHQLAQSDAIEEIIVTARKREENLQEVPISITAFSADAMEAANMIDLRDIGKFTPGMSFTSYGMGSSEAGAIFLRGIGQSDHMVTTDPGVGLYIDGVYMGRNQGAALDLLDLERVEVLRGPQGTLFGKNTIGGAVNVVSRKPSMENGGRVELTVGDEGRFNFAAFGELSLSDQLAVRGSLQSKSRDGVGQQIFTGDETGDEDSISGRAQLYWQGTSSAFSVVTDFAQARQAAMPHSFYAHAPWLGISTCYQPGSGPNTYNLCPAGLEGDPFDSYSLDDLDTEQDLFGIAATWERELSDRLSFKSITAYRDMEYLGNLEFDGAPQVVIHYLESGQSDQFSQEFQLAGSNAANSLDWIAGVYYFSESGHNLQDDDQFGALDQRRSEVDTTNFAVFGQGTLDLAPNLSLTAGLRYTDEEKEYNVVYRRLDRATGGQAVDAQGAPVYLVAPTSLADSWNAMSGTASLHYQATEDLMLYLTYSRGFRSGGFAARPSMPSSVGVYDPEYVDMFEAGMKADALDGRLRANLSAFSSGYEDYQAQVNHIANAFDTRTLNAAEAEITGLEAELTFHPSAHVQIVANFSYTDAEITQVDIAPSLNANFSEGAKLPYVSKYTYSLSPQAEFPMAGGARMLLRADYAWRSAFYGQIANAPEEREGSYGLLNARLEYWSADEKWSLALYGINLTDEKYTRVRNYYPGFIGFAIWNTDRQEIGVKASYSF